MNELVKFDYKAIYYWCAFKVETVKYKLPKLFLILQSITCIVVLFIGFMMFFQLPSCNLQEKRLYTRKEAAEYMKPHIKAVSKLYKQYFSCNIEEIEIVLALLIISETSAPAKNGRWYPLSSSLYEVNNLFGIKADKTKLRKDECVLKETWEHETSNDINYLKAKYNKGSRKFIRKEGNKAIIHDYFATFESYEESLHWWFKKITSKEPLIEQKKINGKWITIKYPPLYEKVCLAENYAEALIQLQVCGYMTDVTYPQKMLNIAKQNGIPQVFR